MTDAQPLFPSQRKNLDKIVDQLLNPTPNIVGAPIVNSGDFLELRDISCYDSQGGQSEHYDLLLVKKDIERDQNGEVLKFTPYNAVNHFEQQGNGLFLPSFRLTCAIVAQLYQEKDTNPEAKKALDQYKNRGDNFGWHTTNTVVHWSGNVIINHPKDTDFSTNGGTSNVNGNQSRTEVQFAKHFRAQTLDKALNDTDYVNFLQDLTGLQKPEILIDIAKYFGKTPKIWTPDTPNYVSGAWLGCNSGYFGIDVYGSLNGDTAVRGVRSR